MKIWAFIEYENSFKMEVPDGLTDEEIAELILDKDEHLDGSWSADWKIIKD